MASSIIGGLVQNGFDASQITASDPNEESLATLEQNWQVNTTTNNHDATEQAHVIVLAIKPQIMRPVCEHLADHFPKDAMIISIAAGISCQSLSQWLGQPQTIIRCMPNTPSLVKEGASGLFSPQNLSPEHKQTASHILSAVGIVEWVKQETDIDAVTAVSGSGPAYFFLMLEAMITAGKAQGLSEDVAARLALQTAKGAAILAQQSDVDVAELRRRVTSPNGTTESALNSFANDQFAHIISRAMLSCADRSRALGEELNNN